MVLDQNKRATLIKINNLGRTIVISTICFVLTALLIIMAEHAKHEAGFVTYSQDPIFLKKFIPDGKLKDEQIVNMYTIRTYRKASDGGSFEILKSNRRVFGKHGGIFEIGNRGDIALNPKLNLIGGDLTGNGKANLIVYEWPGGNHCCSTIFIFEIDEEFIQLIEIDGKDGTPRLADIDGDAVPEILVYDMTYSYYPYSFVGSPTPLVILQWKEKLYMVAPHLMTYSAPSIQELESEAAKIRNSEEWVSGPDLKYNPCNIPSGLFNGALDLMYAGHEDLGWKFIEMAWTEKFPIDHGVLNELRIIMASSPYWRELQSQNNSLKK